MTMQYKFLVLNTESLSFVLLVSECCTKDLVEVNSPVLAAMFNNILLRNTGVQDGRADINIGIRKTRSAFVKLEKIEVYNQYNRGTKFRLGFIRRAVCCPRVTVYGGVECWKINKRGGDRIKVFRYTEMPIKNVLLARQTCIEG